MHVSCRGWKADVQISILTLQSWSQANVYRFPVTEWINTLFIMLSSDVKPNMILSEATWISRLISQVVSSSLRLVIFWRCSALRILWDSVEERNEWKERLNVKNERKKTTCHLYFKTSFQFFEQTQTYFRTCFVLFQAKSVVIRFITILWEQWMLFISVINQLGTQNFCLK